MIKPIRKPCSYKVLPLVYDDSLSYYESICKLSNKVNEIIAYVDTELEEKFREQLDKLFINAMYDKDNETLILSIGIKENTNE